MEPDDFAALLKWAYANDDGGGWLPAAARDLRVNERNLRGMIGGKLPIAPTLADVVCLLVAGRSFLNGWADRWPALVASLSGPGTQQVTTWRDVLHEAWVWDEKPT